MEIILMQTLLMIKNQLAIMEALSVIHRSPELTNQIAMTKIHMKMEDLWTGTMEKWQSQQS